MASETAEVEFFQGEEELGKTDADWHWHVKGRNGEIVASGEGHATRRDAVRAFYDAARLIAEARAVYMEEWGPRANLDKAVEVTN